MYNFNEVMDTMHVLLTEVDIYDRAHATAHGM